MHLLRKYIRSILKETFVDEEMTDEKIIDEFSKLIQYNLFSSDNFELEYAEDAKKIISQGKYSDIFKQPKQKYVWRGLTNIDDLSGEIIDYQNNGDAIVKKNFMYDNNGFTSSWTTDYKIAYNFAVSSNYKNKEVVGPYLNDGIILWAEVSQNPNTFIDLGFLYLDIKNSDAFKQYSNEKEIFCIGPVNVKFAEHVRAATSPEFEKNKSTTQRAKSKTSRG